MIKQLDKYEFLTAISVSCLAGMIDALGFLELGGYFVSFMSGNSTHLAVGIATTNAPKIGLLATILFLFVTGAMLGTIVRHIANKRSPTVAVLAFVTVLLFIAAALGSLNHNFIAIVCMTLSMGAVNASFQKDEDVVGLTYMTGTLVKVGQHIGHAILGRQGKLSWLPYLCLWMGLVTGGASGVILHGYFGLNGLWFAGIWAALITLYTWRSR